MSEKSGPFEPGPPERREQRRAPRYAFIASAREVDVATKTELPGRVSEISEHGCFIDTLNPFPEQTQITLTIEHNEQMFRAMGRVVYVMANMGMGVVFTEMKDEDAEILKGWLERCG